MNQLDQIKDKLLNRYLLFGAVVGTLIFVTAVLTTFAYVFTVDFYFDIANVTGLYLIYIFKDRIRLRIKAGIIICIIFLLFISDLLQFGINSTDKVFVAVLPFISILIFDYKKTILLFLLSMLTFGIVGILFYNRILEPSIYNPANYIASTWINTGLVLTASGLMISLFVHSFNEEMYLMINDLERSSKRLKIRDAELEGHLHEKNVMIQEIHHRVKNNLAIVSGLLELQSFSIKDEQLKALLQKSTNRIMSIAKVHQMLYQSDDISKVPLEKYLDELVNVILNTMNDEDRTIIFEHDIDVEYLNLNLGVPIGIIFNELITNSVKYGFTNAKQGVISISFKYSGPDIEVVYKDNGPGIPDFDESKQKGLGFTLVSSLLTQIDADYVYDVEQRFQLTFRFPANAEKLS